MLDNVVAMLEMTGKGGYTNLEIIERSKNSERYEEAFEAVKEIQDKGYTDSKRIMEAVDTVKEYLKDKMTVRHRNFGNIRFHYFMTFLHQVMPSDEFEYLCYEVNKARGLLNSPKDSDYAAPEYFYVSNKTAGGIMTDTVDKVYLNRGSVRDYALIIALRNYCDDDGKFEGDSVFQDYESYRKLVRDIERINKSPKFKEFMTELTEDERIQIVRTNRKLLLDFEDNFNVQDVKNKLAEINSKNQPQASGMKK
jgi:hypothetical protein